MRSATLALAIKSFIIENPVDRGGSRRTNPWYRHAWRDHAPLWLSKHMLWLRSSTPIGHATFPLCALGGLFQKFTTLWYSAHLGVSLHALNLLVVLFRGTLDSKSILTL